MTRVSFTVYSGITGTAPEILKNFKEVRMDNDNNVGGYAVPVDPMDLLQCDSCQ